MTGYLYSEEYAEYLNDKQSFDSFKNEHYPRFFENKLVSFVLKQGYDYNDFAQVMNMNFEKNYTPEGLLDFLFLESELNRSVDEYVKLIGDKYVALFRSFLLNIPKLHKATLDSLVQSYRIYESESELIFKNKMKSK